MGIVSEPGGRGKGFSGVWARTARPAGGARARGEGPRRRQGGNDGPWGHSRPTLRTGRGGTTIGGGQDGAGS